MNAHDETQRVAKPSLIVASTSPPPPLDQGERCLSKPPSTSPLVQRCLEAAPRPVLSFAPPGAALGCYTGTVIDGRYRIGAILGEGGMGIVYSARHAVIDKKVAIKILRPDFARQKEITDRFLQEARAASSIGNPHIIDISDFGELPDGSTYFVMEYLDGKPLSTILREQGPLPPERLARIGRQIADGLAAAHERGIVHRDLKPENVFIVGRGADADFVKILDFGIAKVSASADSRITRAGALFGTPHYMSPEQAAGTPVDSRADIYALGVILYELASGRVPFDADDIMGILTQHMYKKPTPLRLLVDAPDVPPALEAIILKALWKDLEQRYQTMQDLARDLQKFLQGDTPDAVLEMIARSASTFPASLFAARGMPIPVPAAPRPAARPRWGFYAGMAGAVVACGTVLGVLMHGSLSTAASPTSALAGEGSATAAGAEPGNRESGRPTGAAIDTEGTAGTTAGTRRVGAHAGSPVLFAAQPLDAHVFHDGHDLGGTPLTLEVPKTGSLTVEVRRKGYQTQSLTLDGSESRMTVKLVPIAAAAQNAKPPPQRHKLKAWERSGEIINPWGK